MPHSVASLLQQNLHGVFGEADPLRRRATAEAIYADDVVFHDPKGVHQGRRAVVDIAGRIRATHPDFRYEEIAPPEDLQGTAGRLRFVSGRPGEPPAYAGTDFILVRDGKIAAVFLFFDPVPA